MTVVDTIESEIPEIEVLSKSPLSPKKPKGTPRVGFLSRAYQLEAKNIAIPSELQTIAHYHDLKIRRRDPGGISTLPTGEYYLATTDDKEIDLNLICPDFIEHTDGVFDRNNLLKFLKTLHQPIEVAVHNYRHVTREKDASVRQKAGEWAYKTFIRTGDTDQARILTHQALRFIQSGSAIIPPDPKRKVEIKITEDCHIDQEEASYRAREWHNNHEFGHPEDETISSIPSSQVDLSRGFGFKVEPKGDPSHTFVFSERDKLREALDVALQELGISHEPNDEGMIWLTAEQLSQLSSKIAEHEESFDELITNAEREERQQHERLVSIHERAEHLKNSASFQRQKLGIPDSEMGLKTLLATSSFFTPVAAHSKINQMWARNHWTENFMAPESSPLNALAELYQNMFDDLEAINNMDKPSPEIYSAVVFEHYELLAFSRHLCFIFSAAFAESGDAELAKKAEELKNVARNINNAGVTGVDMRVDEMDEELQDILSDIEIGLGVDASLVKRFGNGVVGAGEEFVEETGYHFYESPWTAAAVAGLLVFLVTSRPEDTMTVQMLDGSTKEIARSAVSPEFWKAERSGAHLDPKWDEVAQAYRWVKHVVSDSVISGPPLRLMEWSLNTVYDTFEAAGIQTNRVNAFDSSFTDGADESAKVLVDANTLQDGTHSWYWVMMAKLGLTDRMRGFGKVMQLSGPLINPLVSCMREKPLVLPAIALAFAIGAQNGYDTAALDAANTMRDLVARSISTGVASSLLALPSLALPGRWHRGAATPFVLAGRAVKAPFTKKFSKKDIWWPSKEKIGHEILDDIEIAKEIGEAVAERVYVEQALPESIRETDNINVKIGGIRKDKSVKAEFTIGAHNLEDVLNALDQYDIMLEHLADEIGWAWSKQKKVKDPDAPEKKKIVTHDFTWYQAFLAEKLQNIRAALEEFQASNAQDRAEKASKLQSVLKADLKHLLGAQARKQEQVDLYKALTGETLGDIVTSALRKNQKRTFGRLKRKAFRQRRIDHMRNRESIGLSTIFKETGLMGLSYGWGGLMNTARGTAGITLEVLPKRVIGAAVGGAAAYSVLAVLTSPDVADGTILMATTTGAVLGGASTVAIGAPVNIAQDVIQNHVVGGAVALGAGAGAAMGVVSVNRITGNSLGRGIQATKSGLGKGFGFVASPFVKVASSVDQSLGNGARKIFMSSPEAKAV